jgi:hypothetical protein
MNYKMILLQAFAIFVAYVIADLPIAFAATTVNIYPTPTATAPTATVTYDISKLVNFQVVIKQRSGGVKVWLKIDGADPQYTVKKIYLYKCMTASPSACSRFTPEPFDTYVDTELEWQDISDKQGITFYPQSANLMIVAKLEDQGNVRWVSIWHRIVRDDFNSFNQFSYEIPQIDVYANSPDMVDAIKIFIENSVMLPVKWLSKVDFRTRYYAIGAEGASLDEPKPEFQAIESSGTQLQSTNREYYFVFPNMTSGVALPYTVNQNPSFTCGDDKCENLIGETQRTCCLDCACDSGFYCDWSGTGSGTCRNPGTIAISVAPATIPTITDCSQQVETKLIVTVQNAPASLEQTLQGTVNLAGTNKAITCEGGPGTYECPLSLASPAGCGNLNYQVGPNSLELSLVYKDGQGNKVQAINTTFGNINIPYQCSCGEGRYCDIHDYVCTNTAPITLSAIFAETYVTGYQVGNSLQLTARVYNPPTGMTVVQQSSQLKTNKGQVSGSINCNTATPTHTPTLSENYYDYPCTMSFTITGYYSDDTYTFPANENNLTFRVSYPDGSTANTKQQNIIANFGPIVIPSFKCGDGKCDANQGEDSTNYCCQDCGCPTSLQPSCTTANPCYCDKAYGCARYENTLGLRVNSISGSSTDCERGHELYVDITINNSANTGYSARPPYDLVIESCAHKVNGEITGVTTVTNCVPKSGPHSGNYNCTLTILPINNCEADTANFNAATMTYTIGGTTGRNIIECEVSFNDNFLTSPKSLRKTVSGSLAPLQIAAQYHCGDGTCEADLGEDHTNCCIDCTCVSAVANHDLVAGDYYCDWSLKKSAPYACVAKSAITLEVTASPTTFSSCEITNEVLVMATLSSSSGSLQEDLIVAGYWAELNGKKAQYFTCQKQEGSDFAYDCKLKIPSNDSCTSKTTGCLGWNHPSCGDGDEGKCASWNYPQCLVTCGTNSLCTEYVDTDPTPLSWSNGTNCDCNVECTCTGGQAAAGNNVYSFTNNEVNFRVNMWDGRNRVSQTVTADMNDIRITQSTRTLKDIIKNGMDLLYDQLTNLQTQMQRMMDAIEVCMEWLIGLTIANLVAMLLAVPLGGWLGGYSSTGWSWNWAAAGTALDKTATIGTTITNTVSKICEMLQKINDMVVKSIELNIQMIQMQLCIDTYQHMIDNGQCADQNACFSSMTSCLNFGNIDSAFQGITDLMGDVNQDMQDLNEGLDQVVEDLTGETGAQPASKYGITMICNGQAVGKCCQHYGEKDTAGNCKPSKVTFKATGLDADCAKPGVWIEEGPEGDPTWYGYINTELEADTSIGPAQGDAGTGVKKVHIRLFCDKNNDNNPQAEEYQGSTLEISYYKAYAKDYATAEKQCRCDISLDPAGTGSPVPISDSKVEKTPQNTLLFSWTTDKETSTNQIRIWNDKKTCDTSDGYRCSQDPSAIYSATNKKTGARYEHTVEINLVAGNSERDKFYMAIGNDIGKYDDITFAFQAYSMKEPDIYKSTVVEKTTDGTNTSAGSSAETSYYLCKYIANSVSSYACQTTQCPSPATQIGGQYNTEAECNTAKAAQDVGQTQPTAPTISNVNVQTHDTSVVVTWTTSVAATSCVQGTGTTQTCTYDNSEDKTTMKTSHSMTKTGLTKNTAYSNWKVVSYTSNSESSKSEQSIASFTAKQYATVSATDYVSLWTTITSTAASGLACKMGDKTKIVVTEQRTGEPLYPKDSTGKPYWKVKIEVLSDYKQGSVAAADACKSSNVGVEYYAWSGGLTLA